MKPATRTLFCWTPRVLALAYIAFLGIFALDVFNEGYSVGEAIAAFLIHLIPNAVVLLALVIAWRWTLIGGSLFLGLSAFYIMWAWGTFPWSVYLIIAGPPAIIGTLFIFNRFSMPQPKPAH